MKTIVSKILLFTLLIGSFTLARADVFDDIIQVFKTMDSRTIASHFDSSIEFKVDENVNNYSKTQAEMVLQNFFNKTNPKQFSLVHKGASNRGTRYAIGNLETEKGRYRIYIYLKDIPGNFVIQQLNIEQN